MITELCIDVIDSFRQLREALASLVEHVCLLDKDLPAWFNATPQLMVTKCGSPRQLACNLISQLEYLDGQQPREILVGAGIIAASVETIEALKNLNQAKDQFKNSMLKLKAANISSNHELLVNPLSRMGLSRLHLKQCYRKLPYLLQRPTKVSWTWANTRSIKKISVQEAEQLLRSHIIDDGIERQLRLLQGLAHSEKLAIIQDLAPHLRANIVMQHGNDVKRLMVKGPVPIFYLATEKLGLPEFTPPGIKHGKDKDRVIRKDVKINPEPFLPAIRAHRYYEACNS
jgi:hypothetical protein